MTNVRKARMTLAVGLLVGCTEPVLIGVGRDASGVGGSSIAGAGGGPADASAETTSIDGSGGGVPQDSAAEDGGAAGAGGDAAGVGGDAGAAGAVGVGACGAHTCTGGTECCYLTASCFDPVADPDACPLPAADGSSGKPCGANSHCKPGEYCRNSNNHMCMGLGECTSTDQDACWAVFYTNDTCACDGYTRPERDSCVAGIRALSAPSFEACGANNPGDVKVYCGNSSAWCPSGTECCMITGLCEDQTKMKDLCVFPEAGAYLPCVSDADCPVGSGFCQGPTCGAPGGCIRRGFGECQGAMEPVCGCDGKTYMNVLCASQVLVPVDHQGPCVDGGT